MDETQIHDYASRLLRAHGDHAEAEAAQKARRFEDDGETEQAKAWQRIRASIAAMRGPHVS